MEKNKLISYGENQDPLPYLRVFYLTTVSMLIQSYIKTRSVGNYFLKIIK